jgi:transposase
VKRYLDAGGWQPFKRPERRKRLDGLEDWLRERFGRHRGNADVVRQELACEKGVVASLRTVQRALAPYRQELHAEARATVRFETAPGRQLQIDFGERLVEISGRKVKVFLFVATLGYSRWTHVRAFRHERQESWFDGLESAVLAFSGVPEEVLFDNARALVADQDAETRTVVFNARLLAFARHWGFRPRACAPCRARYPRARRRAARLREEERRRRPRLRELGRVRGASCGVGARHRQRARARHHGRGTARPLRAWEARSALWPIVRRSGPAARWSGACATTARSRSTDTPNRSRGG